MKKVSGELILITILIIAVVIIVCFNTLNFNLRNYLENKENILDNVKEIESLKLYTFGNDFNVYNYYLVPIDVYVTPENSTETIKICENISPKKHKGINMETVTKYLRAKATITMHNTKDNELIGKAVLTIPKNDTIRAIHCGQTLSYEDLSTTGVGVKSPLGTAYPRLRIVNLMPKMLKLTTDDGNDTLLIPSGKSLLYYGRYENGIPVGTIFKDRDSILPEFKTQYPISDIFMGITSDISLPLYNGTKLHAGNSFNDEPGINFYPLEVDTLPPHRGLFIDTSYVPKNW